MTCNLCAELSKGDSGKKQERREEQRTRAEMRADRRFFATVSFAQLSAQVAGH
jgi:hypothetical protein